MGHPRGHNGDGTSSKLAILRAKNSAGLELYSVQTYTVFFNKILCSIVTWVGRIAFRPDAQICHPDCFSECAIYQSIARKI
jgi:hypothetical protein